VYTISTNKKPSCCRENRSYCARRID